MPTADSHAGVDPVLATAAFDGAVDPTLVVSDDGIVLAANTAAAGILDQLVESGLELPPQPGTTTEVELHTASGHRVVEGASKSDFV